MSMLNIDIKAFLKKEKTKSINTHVNHLQTFLKKKKKQKETIQKLTI